MRCCAAASDAPNHCYASFLVTGGRPLQDAIALVEEGAITPCVTGWCDRCRRHSLLLLRAGDFPCFSAFAAHALTVHALMSHPA
jgi:hypothetical protein